LGYDLLGARVVPNLSVPAISTLEGGNTPSSMSKSEPAAKNGILSDQARDVQDRLETNGVSAAVP